MCVCVLVFINFEFLVLFFSNAGNVFHGGELAGKMKNRWIFFFILGFEIYS